MTNEEKHVLEMIADAEKWIEKKLKEQKEDDLFGSDRHYKIAFKCLCEDIKEYLQ